MDNSFSKFNLTSKQIQRGLLINGDYNVLLERYSKGDRAALLQIVMLDMPNLIFETSRHQVQGVNSEDLINHVTNKIIQYIDEQAELLKEGKIKKNWHQNFYRIYNGETIAYFLKEKVFNNQNELEGSIPFLNKLNDLLSETEIKIINRVKKELEIYLSFFSKYSYHVKIEINYYTNDDDWIPAYCYMTYMNLESVSLRDHLFNHWKDEVKYYPKLYNPYCLLLHDLLNNSTIRDKIADIYQYSVEINFSELNFTDLREHEITEETTPMKIIVTLGEDGRETITKE